VATLISQSREEIAVSIGYNLGCLYLGTCTGTGSTTTWVDAELENSDDYINGKWWRGTSGNNDAKVRPVDDYDGGTTTGTIRGDALTATADGDTYELWDGDVRPALVHNAINQAIRSVPRKGAPSVTDESLHTGQSIRSFAIPSTVIGIRKVEVLASATGENIEECDDAWNEQTVSGVTVVLDDEDCRHGAASNRFATVSIGADTVLASEVVSLDLSGYTHVEFWIKSTVATSAGDLVLRLSATADGASSTDDLSVPALVANTWKRCRVALANPHLDTAIISVALVQVTDLADAYFWIDHVQAAMDNTGTWVPINRNHWSIDSDARELVFDYGPPSYHWLKLTGAQKPTELNADATECDIVPAWIIAKATAIAMRATGDRLSDRREVAHQEADRWEGIAQRAMARMGTPQGMRWVDS